MDTFQLAEKTLAANMVKNCDNIETESGLQAGDVVLAMGCGELHQREAEARLFHCCQSTSVETVTELTEFAKAVPGFQNIDLNDQVGLKVIRFPNFRYVTAEFDYIFLLSASHSGDSLEVWCLRSTIYPPGILHEQRWPPGGPRRRLHHP